MPSFFLRTVLYLCLVGVPLCSAAQQQSLPEGFGYITNEIPSVILEIRYATQHNFTGEKVPGYEAQTGILSQEALLALGKVSQNLQKQGLTLKIFDAYRPQQAVDAFYAWAQNTSLDKMKAQYYPDVEKTTLFDQGFIAKRSGHSRGSTVDLTLVCTETGQELDMGTSFDFFSPLSEHGASGLTAQQQANRTLLKLAMEEGGFRAYNKEWWHYTLKNEPFPNTYFNFPVQ